MKPEFEVPGSVAIDTVLLRTEEAAVTIGLLRAYSTGFEFTVDTRSRRAGQHHRLGMMHRRYALQDGESEDGLRLGLEFSDGRRAEVDASRASRPGRAGRDHREACAEIEADVILAAGARAIVLWPEAPGQPLSGATIGVVTAYRADRGDDEASLPPPR
jgi:hypothetical protein